MPPSPSPVLDAERRAWNYWFVDGLPNLIGGLLCLLLAGASFLLSGPHPRRSPLVIALLVLAYGIYVVVLLRFRQTLEWLKTRITYPRTGYAASPYFTFGQDASPPADLTMLNLSDTAKQGILPDASEVERERQDRYWRLWLTLTVFTAAALCAAFIHQRWICGVFGTAAGLGIWLTTRRDERLSWAVAYGLPFAGMYMFMFHGSNQGLRIERLGSFLAGMGLVLTLTGAVALIRYLRRNPVART